MQEVRRGEESKIDGKFALYGNDGVKRRYSVRYDTRLVVWSHQIAESGGNPTGGLL